MKKNTLPQGIQYISDADRDFPERLREIPDAPKELYFRGSLPDPDIPSVAVIGARMCSEYGRYMARQFGTALGAAGVQVISGMALGVDGISQKAALDAGGTSFGVLGSGVDVCYPEENRVLYDTLISEGGVISESIPGTPPRAMLFPRRNRLIAGLADILLVIEARKKSGTLITVDFALEQGRDVFALPGRATDRLSDGCNELIKQGAFPATSPDDILERFFGKTEAPSPSSKDGKKKRGMPVWKLCAEERAVLNALDIRLKSVAELEESLHSSGTILPVTQIMHTLVQMTLKGLCVQEGSYFRKEPG